MRPARHLIVDLRGRRIASEPLTPAERRRIGGAALGVTLLDRYRDPSAGPLEAGSPWILSIGPLTGTPLSPRPQAVITHLSPLTGGVNDSVVTHPLALALAEAGVAALVLTGAGESPLWLRFTGGRVAFEDARGMWGLDLDAAAAALRAACGSPGLAVGPAGERGVGFACVGSEGHSAGRGGAGAVLASKRVKGIAASSGPGALPGSASGSAREAAGGREPRGGRALERLLRIDAAGGLPTLNFRSRRFEHASALAAGLESRSASRHLPYEGVFAFGPLLGVADPASVLACVDACDRLGLDVISAGGTIAWAMEAVERGALPGPLPRFGEARGLHRLLEEIARGGETGERLAAGSRAAAERLGRGSAAWAMHVRGLEIPGYDPRAFPTLALGYAVGSRGACHVRSGAYQADFDDPLPSDPDPAEVARRAAEFEDRSTLLDSLILSRSWRADLGEPFAGAARLLREAGEADLADPEALRRSMAEVADLRRGINLARGWDPRGDRLPERLVQEDGGAPSAIDGRRLSAWIAAYYARRGWTPGGRPAAATRPN